MVSSEEHQEVLDRFKRYRTAALTGYVIALCGIGFAISGVSKAIDKSNDAIHGNKVAIRATQAALLEGRQRGQVVRGVLCKQLTEKDVNLYKYIKENPPGSGGFSDLLTPKLIKQSLENTARERREIGYAPVPPECNPKVTPKSHESK